MSIHMRGVRGLASLALLASLTVVAPVANAATIRYEVSELKTLQSYFSAETRSINDSGQVVGMGAGSKGQEAIFWAAPTANPPVTLKTDFPFARASGISDIGQIVGDGNSLDGSAAAGLFWPSKDSAPSALRTADSLSFVEPRDINSSGQIVGIGVAKDGVTRSAVIWQGPSAIPIPLPTGNFTFLQAFSINDAGQIVGSGSDLTDRTVPLYWASPTSAPTPLPFADYSGLGRLGISDNGQIAGSGFTSSSGLRAIRWDGPTAQPVKLPVTDGQEYTASSVNDAGQFIGTRGSHEIVFWSSPEDRPVPMGTGYFGLSAFDINNSGAIVGTGFLGDNSVAFFWRNSGSSPTVLPNQGFIRTFALGLNDTLKIVGSGTLPNGLDVPILWTSPTSPPVRLPLGTFPGGDAAGINNAGKIVGRYSRSAGSVRGLYWSSATSTPTELDGGGRDNLPNGINERGEIVGLAPVPERFSQEAIHWQSPSSTPTTLPKGEFNSLTQATGIADDGRILGVGRGASGFQSISWPNDTSAPDELTNRFGTFSGAQGLNNANVLVGSDSFGAGRGPSIWRPLRPVR
jgi:hypothetical protein